MSEIRDRMQKFYSKGDKTVTINAVPGHFATSQSHINYYIDVTRLKVRVSEAEDAARCLKAKLLHHITDVDTIVCLDGTEVLGAFLGDELTKGDFHLNNKHETIYVVQPEENSIHQFMFRENIRPSIEGKHVIVLVDTMTTGETVRRSMECIEYYGGKVEGICAIFSTVDRINHKDVFTLFDDKDLPGYDAFSPADCPYCEKKIPLEAMVNGYGYSKL